jgi:hypothetical protein
MYDKLLKILEDCLRLVNSKSTAQNRSNHREKNPQGECGGSGKATKR